MTTCKYCQSQHTVKYGKKRDTQYYLCRICRHAFAGNGALPGMRYPPEPVAGALTMFYDGLSIDSVRSQLRSLYHVNPSDSTVYEWIIRFSAMAVLQADVIGAKAGDLWIATETLLNIGQDLWLWDIIDHSTRFLLASHMTFAPTAHDAHQLLLRAVAAAGREPRTIIADELRPFLDFPAPGSGSDSAGDPESFIVQPSPNLAAQVQSVLIARSRVMRRMKNRKTARLVMDGWRVHYNFFAAQAELIGKTPGDAAGAAFTQQGWEATVMGR